MWLKRLVIVYFQLLQIYFAAAWNIYVDRERCYQQYKNKGQVKSKVFH